jgi:hypothetical protein
MAEEDKAISWSLKDVFLVVPFFASALALTWEVGFFFRIKGGAFGLFSVAEHIMFALQALPIALSAVALFIMGSNASAVHRAISQAVAGILPVSPQVYKLIRDGRAPPRFLFVVSLLVVLIAVGVTVYTSEPGSARLFVFRTIGLAVGFGILWLINASRSWVMVCLGVLFTFFLAFGIGAETAQHEIESKRPLNVLQIGEKGSSQSSQMRVRILRTGERGILFFDPAGRSLGLLPWDMIRRMDWEISPLLAQ